MKIKEVMAATGLQETTIRYYERMGLISPETQRRNGRTYHTYTQEDVETLRAVVVLRSARFTIQELRSMQEDPEVIPAAVEACRQRLRQEAEETERLSNAMDRMDSAEVRSLGDLGTLLRAVTRQQDREAWVPELRLAALDPPPESSPARREAPLDIDAPAIFNTAALGKKKALDDLKADLGQTGSRPAGEKPKGPGWLRGLTSFLEVLTVIFLTLLILGRAGPMEWGLCLGLGLICLGLELLLRRYPWRKRKGSPDQ